MPYTNVPESMWDKMDECVAKVEGQGKSKDSAIAICHRSIMGEMSLDEVLKNFELDPASFTYKNEEAGLMTGFLYTDLSVGLTSGQAFDALVPGNFIDGNFQRVTVKADDLASIVANTQKAIEATKTEGGEIVGLPIDARNHDKADAAGWIVGIELQGEVIRLLPKWTEMGIDLLSKGLQRFFSATLDLANKVIYGGTLTNWPATRDKKGKVLLRPIELSENLFERTKKTTKGVLSMDITQEELDKKIADGVAAVLAQKEPEVPIELTAAEKDAQLVELRRSYFAQFEAELAQRKFEMDMTELSAKLVGGSEDAPRGYSVKAEELKAHLVKMTPEEAKFWTDLLAKTAKDGLIEFGEVGHGKVVKGLPLPEWAQPYMAEFVKSGKTPEDFFALNPELGNQADFDLSQYVKKE